MRILIFKFSIITLLISFNQSCITQGRIKWRYGRSTNNCFIGKNILKPIVDEIIEKSSM